MSQFHGITAEGHSFQKHALYLFARRIELPLLKATYALLRGKWRWLGRFRVVRWLISVTIMRPFAIYGDSARPIPYDALIERVDKSRGAIAVGPCRCRMGHGDCDHPIETDIVIRTGTQAFTKAFPRDYRVIDVEETKRIISQCHDLGMIHMIFIHCPSSGRAEYAICNCCVCGCVPYIMNHDLGQKVFPLFRGELTAVTNRDKCSGCGKCVEVCPFDARKIVDGVGVTGDCFGCGLCADACPEKAISMESLKRSHLAHRHPGDNENQKN